jgi:[glutamine synthetase] adenylyltransferase / [glutamine synthetase]-adenylyl-L-tyrosine phosphorylase
MADPARMIELARWIDGDRAAELLGRLERQHGDQPARLGAAVLLGSAYPALGLELEAHPESVPSAADLGSTSGFESLAAERDRLGSVEDPAELRRELRRLTRRGRARIALRELLPRALGGIEFERTVVELSDLADAAIAVALAEAERTVFAQLGRPEGSEHGPGRLCVLGMGKLGGRELNPGSDVDLVCIYDTDDAVATGRGGSRTSAHEVWAKVVQRLVLDLEEPSEEGVAWRVDLRLRPEGSRGPLVNSLPAAERYYESFGRIWERAALLRARPVAGDLALGEELLAMLEPFVWSRQGGPTVARTMLELMARARAELCRDPSRDLKLGPGGIREAEFFVQTLQLVWGGRDRSLRMRPTLDALGRLRSAGLASEREAGELAHAYLLLRRAEHAVQHGTGLQIHELPKRPADGLRFARSLGFGDVAALAAELGAHRGRVHERFLSLVPDGQPAASRWLEAVHCIERTDFVALAAALGQAGMATADGGAPSELARSLGELARHPDAPLGIRSLERHPGLAAALLDAVDDAADPEQAAHYLRGFYARLRQPAIYTQHLATDAAALRRLCHVLGSSAFVGEAVASRPELGDLVLFGRDLPTPEAARRDLLAAMAEPLPPGDDPVEQRIGLLRRAKRRMTIEVALADLADEIGTREVSLTLSAAADAMLEAATAVASGLVAGEPGRGLCLLAMGSLGGLQLGYGSDLDLMFVYDEAEGGDDAQARYARVARRVIQLVSMPHAEGPGYELDTRLRPSGRQGLLVVSLGAFARYHGLAARRSEAGPGAVDARGSSPGSRAAHWERLALLRARFAAGDPELGRAAMQLVHEAAYGLPVDGGELGRDVRRLRERMEHELGRERPGRYDLKFGRGGLSDIELGVQLLQLLHADDPRVRTTETRAAIDALGAAGALSAAQADALRDGHGFLRRLEQRMHVVHASSWHLLEEHAVGLGPLARRMGIRERALGDAAARLLQRYRDVTARVRDCYQQILQAAEGAGGLG